ncbi:MAG: hypothetical protein HDR38_01900 [Treponema sp.]|nr:hypothetical protein [Treponema sp.]
MKEYGARGANVRKVSVYFIVGVFLFIPAFAQEGMNLVGIYNEIDKAFSAHSSDAIATVLKTNARSPSYELFENYTLKKTRQLIVRNDLQFAKEAALVVIDNNVENFDAIDLYASIDRAILGEEQKRQAEEEKRQRELARQARLRSDAKQSIERRGIYQAVGGAGDTVGYVNEGQIAYSPFLWTLKIGLIDMLFQNVTKPASYQSFKYGLSVGADLYYATEWVVLGADIFADFQMLSLTGEQEITVSVRAIPQVAFAPLCQYLFLRAGVAAYPLSSNDREKTNSVSTFVSPAVGLGVGNLLFGEACFGAHIDYYPLFNDDVKGAGEVAASVLFPLNVHEKIKVGIEIGVSDVLFIRNEGLDNRIKGIFAIGVGNVRK